MKTQKLKIISIVLLFSITVVAQEPIVDWGQPLANEKVSQRIPGILDADATGFYALRYSGASYMSEDIRLEKFNYEFKNVFAAELAPPGSAGVMGNSQLYRQILPAGNRFLVFYLGWNKSQNKGYYAVREMSKEDGALQKESKELESVTAEKQLNAGNHHAAISPDKKQLVIQTDMPFVKGEKEKIRLRSFDAGTLTELWNKDITIEMEGKRGVNNEPFINNAGNVFMIKKFPGEKGSFAYIMYTYNASSKEWKEHPLTLTGKIIADYRVVVNSKQDCIITGFYATRNEHNTEGTFYFRFDGSTCALAVNKMEPYGAKLLENFMSSSQAAKEGASISDYKIKDVLFYEAAGNVVILAENVNETSTPIPNQPISATQQYSYRISSRDILIANLAEDGSKQWFTAIKKNQSEETTNANIRWGSFVYGLVNNRLFILWNNVDLTPSSIPPAQWKEPDGTVYIKHKAFAQNTVHGTFMYVIEPNGTLTYSNRKYGLPLFNMHKGSAFEMSMNPKVFFPMDDGIILFSEMHNEGKRYRFGKIRL